MNDNWYASWRQRPASASGRWDEVQSRAFAMVVLEALHSGDPRVIDDLIATFDVDLDRGNGTNETVVSALSSTPREIYYDVLLKRVAWLCGVNLYQLRNLVMDARRWDTDNFANARVNADAATNSIIENIISDHGEN